MTTVATHDSQAIALLCASIAVGDAKPLTPAEWARLATAIHESEWSRPGELVGLQADELRTGLGVDPATASRVVALLERGGALAFEFDRLANRGIWLVTRADDEYPATLKKRLGLRAPAVLFGAGRREIVPDLGVAVVGSRDASEEALGFADDLGRSLASDGAVVVSGAARGIDRVAMGSALDVGGQAVGVVADSLVRTTQGRDVREALADERLTLVTPHSPEARFTPGNAMGRNRLIYCLADVAVVVATSAGSGGTWAGAIENLKGGWVPLWVWDATAAPPGNRELLALGGHALGTVLPAESLMRVEPRVVEKRDSLKSVATALESFLGEPRSERDVQAQFGLTQSEARALLARAVEAGIVSRSERPVRYVATARRQATQTSLFDAA